MARQARLGDPIEVTTGPYLGVFDSPDPGEASSRRLFDAVNMFVPDATNGSAVVARHGMQGSHTQLGDVANATGQAVWLHRRLNGAVDRYVFVGGHFYEWDGASGYTELTPAGIKIDPVNPIFCASYNDKLIVSDENNKPWLYDPNANTAATIEIDSLATEWSSKGGPAVYGGKVFFILRAKGLATLTAEDGTILDTELGVDLTTELTSGFQNTIVWSEELTPDVGYEQTNFSNLWQLTQSSGDVLGALSAEEGELVYFRNHGIGYITGAVQSDFKASATKDTVSTTIGTDAPAALMSINRRIWFVDLDGRIYRAVIGAGEPQQLWFPVRRGLVEHIGTAQNRANVVANARVGLHEDYNLVLFTIWDKQTIYAFDADTGTYVGTWPIGGDTGAGIFVDALGATMDANSRSSFVLLGTRANNYVTAAQGVLWRQKQPDDVNQWLDQPDDSIATFLPLTRAVETHWLNSSACRLYRANLVAAELLGDSAPHQVGLEYVVPASGKSARVVALSTPGVGEKSATDTISVVRWSLGPNAQGTGLRMRLSATHADNVRFGVQNVTVTGVVTSARPASR